MIIFDLQIQALKIFLLIKKYFITDGLKKWTGSIGFILLAHVCLSQAVQDNIRFNHFSTDQGLSQSQFECILQDSKGYMWFGTYNGLIKYDGYSFTTFQTDPSNKNSLPTNYVNHLCEDGEGN